MYPPEHAEQDDIVTCSESTEPRTNPCSHQGPGCSVAGRVLESFDKSQGNKYCQDQAKDNEAIPGAMQKAGKLFGAYNASANSKHDQGDCHKNNEQVQQCRKYVAIAKERQRDVEGAKHQV